MRALGRFTAALRDNSAIISLAPRQVSRLFGQTCTPSDFPMPEGLAKLKTASVKGSSSKASNRSDAPSSTRSSKSSSGGKKKTKSKSKKSDLNAVEEESTSAPLAEVLAAVAPAPVFGTLAWAQRLARAPDDAPAQEAAVAVVATVTGPVYGTLAWAEAIGGKQELTADLT